MNQHKRKSEVRFTVYHRRIDHHIMDYYALGNIFNEKVAKGDLVIKNGKRGDQRWKACRLKNVYLKWQRLSS